MPNDIGRAISALLINGNGRVNAQRAKAAGGMFIAGCAADVRLLLGIATGAASGRFGSGSAGDPGQEQPFTRLHAVFAVLATAAERVAVMHKQRRRMIGYGEVRRSFRELERMSSV